MKNEKRKTKNSNVKLELEVNERENEKPKGKCCSEPSSPLNPVQPFFRNELIYKFATIEKIAVDK